MKVREVISLLQTFDQDKDLLVSETPPVPGSDLEKFPEDLLNEENYDAVEYRGRVVLFIDHRDPSQTPIVLG